MNELKDVTSRDSIEYIKFLKKLKKQRIIDSINQIFFKFLGYTLVVLVIIGIFYSMLILTYYLKFKIKNYLEGNLYFLFCFTICYFLISKAYLEDEMHLIKNYKKPIYYYFFISFSLIGTFLCYDLFIQEAFAKNHIGYSVGVEEMDKTVYDTNKMCNYHLSQLLDELETFAMNSDSQEIMKKIFNSNIETIRSGNLTIEFNSFLYGEIEENTGIQKIVDVHIKAYDGIVTIVKPKFE